MFWRFTLVRKLLTICIFPTGYSIKLFSIPEIVISSLVSQNVSFNDTKSETSLGVGKESIPIILKTKIIWEVIVPKRIPVGFVLVVKIPRINITDNGAANDLKRKQIEL